MCPFSGGGNRGLANLNNSYEATQGALHLVWGEVRRKKNTVRQSQNWSNVDGGLASAWSTSRCGVCGPGIPGSLRLFSFSSFTEELLPPPLPSLQASTGRRVRGTGPGCAAQGPALRVPVAWLQRQLHGIHPLLPCPASFTLCPWYPSSLFLGAGGAEFNSRVKFGVSHPKLGEASPPETVKGAFVGLIGEVHCGLRS